MRLADSTVMTMRDARARHPDFDLTRSWDLPFEQTPPRPDDEPLDAYLRRLGFNADQLYYTRRSWGNAEGDDISRVSALAAVEEMSDTDAGDGDWMLTDGYDRLIEHVAAGLDVRLNTVVTEIDWSGAGVIVHTADGAAFTADRVVITLPLGVLKAHRVRFTPDLPAGKRAAIDGLTMGAALKLVYRFSEPVFDPALLAYYSPLNPPMWWMPQSAFGASETVVIAFATGAWATELLESGEPLARGLRALEAEVGRALTPTHQLLVDWVHDEFALGGYSVAPPGASTLRAVLAQPVVDRLFWAGEATASNAWSSTVHGAYVSGRRAAAEIQGRRAQV